MLLTRPLPPQFLLPAWSAHQLAQLVQRAYSTDSKPLFHYMGKTSSTLHRRLDLSYREESRDGPSSLEGGDEDKKSGTREWIVQGWGQGNKVQQDEARHKHSKGDQGGSYNVYRHDVEQRREAARQMQTRGRKHIQGGRDLEEVRRKVSDREEKLKSWAPVTLSKLASSPPRPAKAKTKKKRAVAESKTEKLVPTQPSALSLFDELFPEERHTRTPEQRLAEQRLDKLPAFNWTPEISIDSYEEERQMEPKQDRFHRIPERHPLNPAAISTRHTPASGSPLVRYGRGENQALSGGESVLVLNACSKTLEESDFFRLSPKGQHIEGWKSGLLKVIPSRDNKTLESLGTYFLLFSNDATARAYLDQTMRLHTLTKLHRKQKEAQFPLPPGYLKEGEDLETLLKGFSLIPGFVKLNLRMLNRPYSPRLKALITEGGPVAMARREANTENLVLFTTDRSRITHADILEVMAQDGRRRNMHWKLAGDRQDSIIKIQSNGRREPGGFAKKNSPFRGGPRTYEGPSRFIISFKDSHEARRFVREWHRRPLPVQQGARAEDEPPPIVNAEILW
ncbi:hypothetical protein BDZ45DRAFT_799068 [Acephala macrosclerotiorum]|nr:hypothetical protein BDZ45DRAFT_799068 [Acephala macrosclerotiorum]